MEFSLPLLLASTTLASLSWRPRLFEPNSVTGNPSDSSVFVPGGHVSVGVWGVQCWVLCVECRVLFGASFVAGDSFRLFGVRSRSDPPGVVWGSQRCFLCAGVSFSLGPALSRVTLWTRRCSFLESSIGCCFGGRQLWLLCVQWQLLSLDPKSVAGHPSSSVVDWGSVVQPSLLALSESLYDSPCCSFRCLGFDVAAYRNLGPSLAARGMGGGQPPRRASPTAVLPHLSAGSCLPRGMPPERPRLSGEAPNSTAQ